MTPDQQQDPTLFSFDAPRPIKGFPVLHWQGKRPFTSTQYYPAQLKETYSRPVEGWLNEIYWGDNLQVMSHLLKKYRGQVKLVYIDPPYDSKADYSKKVQLRGKQVNNDNSVFEDKQYTDIWSNDEYLQFMYERLTLLREILSEDGSIYLHCDWHKSHHLRCILDELFGPNNLQNEIIWQRTDPHNDAKSRYGWVHDSIFWYAKNKEEVTYNWADVVVPLSIAALKEYSLVKLKDETIVNYVEGTQTDGRRFKLDDCTYKGNNESRRFEWRGAVPSPKRVWPYSTPAEMDAAVDRGEFYLREPNKGAARCRISFLDQRDGQVLQTIWTDTGRMKGGVDYPTQKPNDLLERIIKSSSNPGDIVFDCFMGSGTTQAVAMKLGRRFIGADINLGAVQTTTKRLLGIATDLREKQLKIAKEAAIPKQLAISMAAEPDVVYGNNAKENAAEQIKTYYTGFSIYNVNHYDVFRNPLEARDLLLQALEVQPYPAGSLYDGEKDGRQVKIMPVNRIATRVDLNPLITGFNQREFEERSSKHPGKPVEYITLVCMGHEPDLAAALKEQVLYKLDIEVVDILRDKANLEFKRDAEADVVIENGKVIIRQFYPMNLLQKLSLMKENVEEWRELVESVMIDFNYDGAVLEPSVVDIPDSKDLVLGEYPIPEGAGTIRVKITDLLSESLEITLKN